MSVTRISFKNYNTDFTFRYLCFERTQREQNRPSRFYHGCFVTVWPGDTGLLSSRASVKRQIVGALALVELLHIRNYCRHPTLPHPPATEVRLALQVESVRLFDCRYCFVCIRKACACQSFDFDGDSRASSITDVSFRPQFSLLCSHNEDDDEEVDNEEPEEGAAEKKLSMSTCE